MSAGRSNFFEIFSVVPDCRIAALGQVGAALNDCL